jgi:UDP-3-O-[3-hydroxymyristoyl] glucosamine N-acyltransferase
MKVTAGQLAEMLQGTLEGDPSVIVTRPAPIELAQSGDFAFIDSAKYEAFAYTTGASVLLVHDSFAPQHPVTPALIRVADVRACLSLLLERFSSQVQNGSAGIISEEASVHPQARLGVGVTVGAFAVIEAGAIVGDHCTIYPQVYVGRNARVGTGTVLHAGAKIHYDCVVGANCIIGSNAVIGTDGFGYHPQPDHSWKKVPHVGNVILEDSVEIGACTCIDRASMGSTVVHSGVKLDNLVHIAHNVDIGKNTVMAAQSAIAGSTKIGEHVQVGGQAGIVGHIKVADNTRIQAQSGIGSHIEEPGKAFFGTPAIPYGDYVRSHVVFKQLPDLQKKVRALEKQLAELTAVLSAMQP